MARSVRLTLPERAIATWFTSSQQRHRTASVLRLEANYGPQGLFVLCACLGLGVVFGVVALIGIAVMIISGGAAAGYLLIAVGVVGETLPIARAAQAARLGRTHRRGQPVIR